MTANTKCHVFFQNKQQLLGTNRIFQNEKSKLGRRTSTREPFWKRFTLKRSESLMFKILLYFVSLENTTITVRNLVFECQTSLDYKATVTDNSASNDCKLHQKLIDSLEFLYFL